MGGGVHPRQVQARAGCSSTVDRAAVTGSAALRGGQLGFSGLRGHCHQGRKRKDTLIAQDSGPGCHKVRPVGQAMQGPFREWGGRTPGPGGEAAVRAVHGRGQMGNVLDVLRWREAGGGL